MQEGLRRSAGQPPKLRLNSTLNAITRRGPFLGNSAGVIAMVYNGFNSFIGHVRGKHDAANSIAAGALSGMIFKCTRGVRPMMISGGVVASIAGGWAVSIPLSLDPKPYLTNSPRSPARLSSKPLITSLHLLTLNPINRMNLSNMRKISHPIVPAHKPKISDLFKHL